MTKPTYDELQAKKAADEKAYELLYKAAVADLKPLLTDDVLIAMVKAAQTVGWGVDLIEINQFIQQCYEMAEKPVPTWEPFEYDGTDG